MMKQLNPYTRLFALLAALLLWGACTSDELDSLLPQGDGNKVYFSLQTSDPTEVTVTRATDTENTIRTARLLVFDSEENCFHNQALDENPNTDYTNTLLGVPVQADETKYKTCTVWLLANIAIWEGVSNEGDLNLGNIQTLDELKAKFGRIQASTINPANRNWMPMAGSLTNVDMTTPGSIAAAQTLSLTRILAKVNFQVNIQAENLSFYFNNWYLENVPNYTYVLPHDKDYYDDHSDAEEPFYPSPDFTTNQTTQTVEMWYGSGTATGNQTNTYSFYTYENRRGDRGNINWDNMSGEAGDYAGLNGQVSDPDGNNPKYKTLYAPENATFLVITGLIRQRSGDTGEIQSTNSFAYRIALGANNYDDYNLLRNYEYTYNINIKGITYDDVTVDVFDSRVHKAYALQIDAPSMDRIDCHYDKRYMHLVASKGDFTLQLYPTQADAEAGIKPLTTGNCPFILSSTENTYDYELVSDKQTGLTLSATSDDEVEHHVYLYAKENLTTEAINAVLKVTHTPAQGSSELVQEPVHRYLTVRQAGLIPITVTINGKEVQLGVESYEECDMRINPHENTGMDGLQWGWSGTSAFTPRTGISDETYDVTSTTDGSGNTTKLYNYEQVGNTAFDGVDVNSLYNNYAARYCYNKNRRNADGTVSTENVNWYLPAIDELLPLTAATGVEGMQGTGYWSSSVPTYEEATSKPSWWLGGIIGDFAWTIIYNIFIANPNSTHYYTKVAKAAINGEEQTESVSGEGQSGNLYNQRTLKKHIRAVRLMPSGN